MGSDGNVQFSCISIHALREEGDGGVAAVFRSFACISIHALREEGDDKRVCKGVILIISIHALREEGDLIAPTKIDLQAISIHALREEGDLRTDAPDVIANISIHALREEGDYNTEAIKLLLKEFLSTPSARRATLHGCLCRYNGFDFYPRPPRGGRPDLPVDCHGSRDISIHALREEGDKGQDHGRQHFGDFYPRPPRGGRH